MSYATLFCYACFARIVCSVKSIIYIASGCESKHSYLFYYNLVEGSNGDLKKKKFWIEALKFSYGSPTFKAESILLHLGALGNRMAAVGIEKAFVVLVKVFFFFCEDFTKWIYKKKKKSSYQKCLSSSFSVFVHGSPLLPSRSMY